MAMTPQEIQELVLRIRTEGAKQAALDVEKLRVEMQAANRHIRDAVRPGPEFAALRAEFERSRNTAAQFNAEMEAVGRANRLKDLARDYVDVTRGGIRAEEAQETLNRSLARMNASQAEIRGVAQEIDRVGQAADRAAAQTGRIFSGGRLQGGALGRIGSELRMLPSIPIPGTSFGSDSIANVLRISGALDTMMQKLGITMGQVVAAGGLAVPAIILVVEALKTFTSELDRQKRFIELLLDVNKDYYAAERRLTTEQAQQRLRDLQDEADAARRVRDDAQRALTTAAESYAQNLSGVVAIAQLNPFGALNEQGRPINAREFGEGLAERFQGLQTQLNESQDELAKAEAAVAKYTQGLEDNAFAVNDAREGLERLTELFAAPDTFEVVAGFRDIGRGIVRTLTSVFTIDESDLERASENRVAALERELAVLEQASEQEQFFADVRRAGIDDIDGLAEQLRTEQARMALANEQIPVLQQLAEEDEKYAEQLEAAKDALEESSVAVGVLTNRLGELRAAALVQDGITGLLEAGREYNKVLQKQAEDIAKITARFEEQQATLLARAEEADLDARLRYEFDYDKLTRDFDAKNLEAEIEAQQKEQDVRDDFNDKREQQLADHNRKLADIERDYQFDYQSAVGNRDELAANEAERRRQKEIDDENARFEGLQAEREKEQEQRIEELRANAEAERAERKRDLDRRRDELARAFRFEQDQRTRKYNTDLRQLTDKFNAEIRLQNQALNAQLQQTSSALMAEFALHNQFWGGVIGVAQRAVQAVGNIQPVSYTPAPANPLVPQYVYSRSFYDIQRSMGVPGFADGLKEVPYDNFLARLHKKERVLTAYEAQRYERYEHTADLYTGRSGGSRGGLTINVPVTGTQMTKRQIKAHVIDELDDKLTKAGW